MDVQLHVPTVVVDGEAIRSWISAPDAGLRAGANADLSVEDAETWWDEQYVGDHAAPPHVAQDPYWLDDLLLYARHSDGLFGEAQIRGWVQPAESLGVKDWTVIMGLSARSASGNAVTIVEDLSVGAVIFPEPEGSMTDVTVAILERIGHVVERIAANAS
jgi:hypothetical protein